MRITKEQLKALKIKYTQSNLKRYLHCDWKEKGIYIEAKEFYSSFLSFRRNVQTTFCNDGSIVIQWCGMWLCIETDGYTHS